MRTPNLAARGQSGTDFHNVSSNALPGGFMRDGHMTDGRAASFAHAPGTSGEK